jgi:shikimate dehydrogenase
MAGEQAGALPCQLATADRGTLIVDIVYNPELTPWLSQAEGLGLPVLGGLPMLVYQGAAAFSLWFGQVPPVEAMFEAARAALAGSH